jgi:GNAT superfamily N-acetyltransferase
MTSSACDARGAWSGADPRAGWTIRLGTTADYDGVRRLWETVYGMPRSLDSLRWLYQENPAGACRLWLAEDPTTGEIVAVRPVFPWRIRVRRRDLLVGQAGDAMTHPDFRGRGIFSALVRVAWAELRDRDVPFSFSFSNAGSLSVYKKIVIDGRPRAGTHEVLRFQRLVYPLSLQLVRLRMPALCRRLLLGLDAASRPLQRLRLALPGRMSVSSVHRFGEEFDELWTRTADEYGLLTVRDSRYLNWRYVDPPSGRFQVLALRVRGELVGYVVFDVDADDNGSIADIFGLPSPEIIAALLRAALAAMLEAGCIKASIWVATQNPFLSAIRACGFLPRSEYFPMAVHRYGDGREADAALDARCWWAWCGDRDVERLAERPLSPAEQVSHAVAVAGRTAVASGAVWQQP